ncbi:MAG: glycosyltransferase family 10 [Anaerolineaceae bacterium]
MFTDLNRPFTLVNIHNLFEWRMASKKYTLELSENPDVLFYSCTGDEHLKYNCTRVFYTPENVRPNFNRCDYAFSFDYPVSERNYRLPFYRRLSEYKQLFRPRNPDYVLNQQRKFCSFMVSNSNAITRIEFFKKLSSYKNVDSGGRFLNNIGDPIQTGVENKLKWMNNYKFSITFENSSYPGYTTEKLMHALITDTIPIYWGNPLASLDFNPKAFINCHDFSSFDEVIELVTEIDQNENLYKEYLSQPYLKDNVETDFCREECILARYDEILGSKRIYVSPLKKSLQGQLYHPIKWQKVGAKLIRKFVVYSKHALLKLKGIIKF